MEQRRQIRAQRNRESAEKSRMRRKQQTAELEENVGDLRDENKTLKARLLGLESVVHEVEEEIDRNVSENASEGATRGAHAVQDSLSVIQACKSECLRTFREAPGSPDIELKRE